MRPLFLSPPKIPGILNIFISFLLDSNKFSILILVFEYSFSGFWGFNSISSTIFLF